MWMRKRQSGKKKLKWKDLEEKEWVKQEGWQWGGAGRV